MEAGRKGEGDGREGGGGCTYTCNLLRAKEKRLEGVREDSLRN